MLFTKEEENILCGYLLMFAGCNYRFTTKETRSIAFMLAKNIIKNASKTGEAWLKVFLQQHPNLSLRLPKPMSISCATGFNKTNVTDFFDNYTVTFLPKSVFAVDHVVIQKL